LKVLGNRLGNEQPVEGVPVMQWQLRNRCRMDRRHKQLTESAGFISSIASSGSTLIFVDAEFNAISQMLAEEMNISLALVRSCVQGRSGVCRRLSTRERCVCRAKGAWGNCLRFLFLLRRSILRMTFRRKDRAILEFSQNLIGKRRVEVVSDPYFPLSPRSESSACQAPAV